jgi:hypothetical protein
MQDIRLEKLADLLVNYSVKVRKKWYTENIARRYKRQIHGFTSIHCLRRARQMLWKFFINMAQKSR